MLQLHLSPVLGTEAVSPVPVDLAAETAADFAKKHAAAYFGVVATSLVRRLKVAAAAPKGWTFLMKGYV